MYTTSLLNAARLGLGYSNCGDQRSLGVHHAHAASTAAAGGLDDDRVADLARHAQVLIRVIAERSIGSRYARHTSGFH
jgi:hypothetical protein